MEIDILDTEIDFMIRDKIDKKLSLINFNCILGLGPAGPNTSCYMQLKLDYKYTNR